MLVSRGSWFFEASGTRMVDPSVYECILRTHDPWEELMTRVCIAPSLLQPDDPAGHEGPHEIIRIIRGETSTV